MATQINVPLMKKEIEKQKNQCLYGPICVWADSSVSKSVNSVCSSFSGICNNPNLFKTFSYSASTNPAKIATDLASCLPRVLIIALANLDDPYVEKWIRSEFSTYLKKVPFSDIRFVNTRGLNKDDRIYLESFSIIANPTVLVFKMGHLIDSFVPPIDKPISSNPSIAEQLRQRNEAIMQDLSRNPPPPPGGDDSLLTKHEKEKKQWEEKERLKKIEEARKEREEKRKERLRVKARIEEQRRMRQQNH